jgi:hypothetical protein
MAPTIGDQQRVVDAFCRNLEKLAGATYALIEAQ